MANEPRPPKVRIVTGPPEGGPFRETVAHLRRPLDAALRGVRTWWLMHRGITRARRWRNPFGTTVGIWVFGVLTAAFVIWALRGLVVAIFFNDTGAKDSGWWWGDFNPDKACSKIGTSCGAANGVVMPVLLLAVSTVLFLAWRIGRVRRFCTRKAKTEAGSFVQTAGSLMDEVVGRDQLCNAIMNNLRDRKARRPHIVVANVGAGKTALLVRLAEKLAAKGAVPIPVRLRDAQGDTLDFCTLARERFQEIVQPVVRSDGEVDRIWRWLRQRADRIVVLGDGLEETLSRDHASGQRDNLIRKAIRKAGEEGLPLVIASRPHEPLRAMQAAMTELEPLSAEAALQYIASSGSWRSDALLLDRVVEVARMSESPIYLQIAKDLHRRDLLEPLWTEGGTTDPTLHDTWELRGDLMERWLDALVDGDVHSELPIDRDTRLAVVAHLSALACVGLASDRAEVGLWELDPRIGGGQDGEADDGSAPAFRNDEWNRRVAEELDCQLDGLRRAGGSQDPGCPSCESAEAGSGANGRPGPEGPRTDLRLAATWGARMGLVHEYGRKARFQHSVMQAYLGSRFLARVLGSPVRGSPAFGVCVESVPPWAQLAKAHIRQALRQGGRELLIALTLHSRSLDGRCRCDYRQAGPAASCSVSTMRELLREEAGDLLDDAARAEKLGQRCTAAGPVGRGHDDRGSARLRALRIYGAAVEIDSVDATSRQTELFDEIREHWAEFGWGQDPQALRDAKLALVAQCGSAARRVAVAGGRTRAYESLFGIGRCERDYRVRAAIAREAGSGGEQAYRALALYERLESPQHVVSTGRPASPPGEEGARQPYLDWVEAQGDRERRAVVRLLQRRRERCERLAAHAEALEEREKWYANTMCAWALPMLVDSAMMTRHLGSPRDDLEKWTAQAVDGAGSPNDTFGQGGRSALGVALAQGFKYAANRRLSPHSDREARQFLVKQAQDMLKRSTFWYTRLTLLHALTLWALPDDVHEDQPLRGHGADPGGQVREWLTRDDGQKDHPLVEAAGKLAVRALQTRRPERFLWIDEAGVASEVGTEVGRPGEQRVHNLWIPPSTGWSTLDPAAQQLLADVLILAVLGERGYRPKDLFRLLERCSPEGRRLPSCLSRDRTRLDPVRAVERTSQPGSNCTDECGMRMCPYPAKAENLRLEFSEVFCLHQLDLLRAWQPRTWLFLRFRREAPWQRRVPVAGMRRFWDQMGDRARDVNPGDDARPVGRRDRR
ncbi:NACHT domain-containing protein [Streptomyces sp. ISL-11]|uniref:NACHT domain-containing protein n=1 Tax=Streptomyces sp. ISL-11 TaxID=2819174 RepID=UPI001BE89FAA|nr:NACHT domain-containing protein [Streptomyces sp. ISL-11]MBT2385302.1 NACHT domain-containing protein [Streptomyces sp. ISL-11]